MSIAGDFVDGMLNLGDCFVVAILNAYDVVLHNLFTTDITILEYSVTSVAEFLGLKR